MKHGRRAQQKRRKLRNKIVEQPNSEWSKDELVGQTIDDLKEILENFSLTEQEIKELDSGLESIDKAS